MEEYKPIVVESGSILEREALKFIKEANIPEAKDFSNCLLWVNEDTGEIEHMILQKSSFSEQDFKNYCEELLEDSEFNITREQLYSWTPYNMSLREI